MRTGMIIAIVLLVVVLVGSVLTANLTYQVSQRYVAASRELLTMVESDQWERAAATLVAYQETWQETLSWLELLVHHDDTDDVTLAMARLEAGIRTKDLPLCVSSCNELQEDARHIYHRDAFALNNVL